MNTEKTQSEAESQPSCLGAVSGRYSLEEAKKFAMEKFNAQATKSKYPKGGWISIDDILSVLEVGVECGYKFGQKSNDH